MRYLHTMVRVQNLEQSLFFYQHLLGLEKIKEYDYPENRFSLLFLAPKNQHECPLELTYNWDNEHDYGEGRNFGHIAYEVDNIYAICQKLADNDVVINRPPRDGRMAFVRSPDNISIELLQQGAPLPIDPHWANQPNIGAW